MEPTLAPHQESPLKGVLQQVPLMMMWLLIVNDIDLLRMFDLCFQAKASHAASSSAAKDLVTWTLAGEGPSLGKDVVLCIQHKYELKQVTWHAKGDYFTTLNPQSNKTAILVHQLSKFTTQVPPCVRARL